MADEIIIAGGRVARLVAADAAGEFRLWIRNGDVLDQLYAAGALDQEAWLAGRRYAEAWEASGLRQRLAGDLQPAPGRRYEAPMERQTDAQAAALRAWRTARRAVPAPARAEVDRVVVWGEAVRGRALLLAGLAALVRHYGR